jgi:hypothetical protein
MPEVLPRSLLFGKSSRYTEFGMASALVWLGVEKASLLYNSSLKMRAAQVAALSILWTLWQ